MYPERWQKIDRLFHQTLEREPGERTVFLAQACADDESLRTEVEALIASHDRAETFIETPPSDLAAELLAKGRTALDIGQAVGPYKIVSVLGTGGMGEVYLVQDTRLGRQVALKLLSAQFTIDTERVRRFEQEARAASALNHPNIVTIHEVGEINETQFIVTEFVEGETLRAAMERSRMSLPNILDIAKQVGAALEAAHEAGIVHRDIKPDNIMIRRRDGIVKVLDFGLAKLTEKNTDKQIAESKLATRRLVRTMAGVVMGTTYYMSPEQARGADTDERTDIWSLGIVLYEMLAGLTPFTGDSAEDVRASILKDELQPLPRNVPEAFRSIVEKALRKDREDRYRTIGELLLDLSRARTQFERWEPETHDASEKQKTAALPGNKTQTAVPAQATAPPISTTSSAEYIISEIRRHKGGTALAIVTIVLLVVGVFGYFSADRTNAGNALSTIAVLPFVNAGGNPNEDYFSDGVTESLINSLSQLPNTRVLARTTVFRYKGKEADPRKVGTELGVDALLMGRVLRQGDTLTIQADLVRVSDGMQMWGARYDRKLADVLVMQEDIARQVSDKLRPRSSGKTEQQVARRYTDNVDAYQLYLQGRFSWNNYARKEDLLRSIQYFQAAIAKDSNYALAYSGLADAYITLGMDDWESPKEVFPRAREYAMKALAIDDQLGEAHYSRGAVAFFYEWDWDLAQTELQRALDLNAKSVETNACYLHSLDSRGKSDEAIAVVRRALDQNPLSTFIQAELGCASYYGRRYDQAIDFSEETIRRDAGYPVAHYNAARPMGQKQMYEQSVTELNRAMTVWGRNMLVLSELGYDYAASGRKIEARKILAEMKAQTAAGEFVDPYPLAFVYVGLGENDEAIKSLQEAYQARSTWMPWINVEPKFDALRSDSRFQDLIRRLQLKV